MVSETSTQGSSGFPNRAPSGDPFDFPRGLFQKLVELNEKGVQHLAILAEVTRRVRSFFSPKTTIGWASLQKMRGSSSQKFIPFHVGFPSLPCWLGFSTQPNMINEHFTRDTRLRWPALAPGKQKAERPCLKVRSAQNQSNRSVSKSFLFRFMSATLNLAEWTPA